MSGGDNRRKKGADYQGTSTKDPWRKPKVGRIKCGMWGWVGQGRMLGEKWRELYLNNNKNKQKRQIYTTA